jgi:teichuronic acid biosynthesis glycosyltransferase TuaH
MTALTTRRPPRTPTSSDGLALAVADANWFSTANLFRELDRPDVSALLLHCSDYRNAWRRGWRPWSRDPGLVDERPGLHRRELVLPSGWMKQFPRLGMRPIRRAVLDWRAQQAPRSRLGLVMTYPHYLYLRDLLRPDLSIYFNLDDYALYWPGHAEELAALERRAVRESDLTICVSRLRCEQLRAAVPESAAKVRHLPHGTPTAMLAPTPHLRPGPAPADLAALPGPRFGFIGSLEDRIDWDLLATMADAFPSGSVVLIGRLVEGSGDWVERRRRCLQRPNVHVLGWRDQAEIARYNAAFDACLIPYRVDHPFNLACCPTKIMDCMGTGRPIVSSALPECLLHRDRFDVADDPDAFLAAVERAVSRPDDDRAQAPHAWARSNTCREVAGRLIDWLIAEAACPVASTGSRW